MNRHYGNWQVFFEAALFETHPINLAKKIDAAQSAINDRLEDSLHGRDLLDTKERQAIENALVCLRTLKQHQAA